MVSLRDGKVAIQPSEGPQILRVIEPADPKSPKIKNAPAPRDKKRKADAAWAQQYHSEEELNKENIAEKSSTTSSPVASKVEIKSIEKTPEREISKQERELKPHEKTPGRDGPIKPDIKFDCEPDIAPFKGPPGKKVRKTAREKDEEYRKFGLENEGHCFHELYVCHAKGPNGSPTYDKSGFQLDWHKVDDWMRPKPFNKKRVMNGMNKAVDKAQQDSRAMAAIFFEKGEAPENPHLADNGPWKDRVSKDLGVPWHKVGVEEFEQWEKKGFKKARKGDYENLSKEEKARMLRLLSGASLRK